MGMMPLGFSLYWEESTSTFLWHTLKGFWMMLLGVSKRGDTDPKNRGDVVCRQWRWLLLLSCFSCHRSWNRPGLPKLTTGWDFKTSIVLTWMPVSASRNMQKNMLQHAIINSEIEGGERVIGGVIQVNSGGVCVCLCLSISFDADK